MIAAHIFLGTTFALLAGGCAWLVFDAAFWWVILAYCGVGSVACLVSAGVAMVIASICPGRPEHLSETSRPDVPNPYA